MEKAKQGGTVSGTSATGRYMEKTSESGGLFHRDVPSHREEPGDGVKLLVLEDINGASRPRADLLGLQENRPSQEQRRFGRSPQSPGGHRGTLLGISAQSRTLVRYRQDFFTACTRALLFNS